jgi:hypothetical protein
VISHLWNHNETAGSLRRPASYAVMMHGTSLLARKQGGRKTEWSLGVFAWAAMCVAFDDMTSCTVGAAY